MIQYVKGSESPHYYYAQLQCVSVIIHNTFNGSHGVINNVPSNEQCKLLVTDGDAASFINCRAAVTIEGITVPSITTYAETKSTQSTPTAGLA